MLYTRKTVKDAIAATKRAETVPDLTLPEDSVVVPVDGVAFDPVPVSEANHVKIRAKFDNVQLLVLCDFTNEINRQHCNVFVY